MRKPKRHHALGHHLCGIELAHASASDPQIAAGLGHSTMKQMQTHRKQASHLLLARGAQNLRDAMYEQGVAQRGDQPR
jgi:hypothetical protein